MIFIGHGGDGDGNGAGELLVAYILLTCCIHLRLLSYNALETSSAKINVSLCVGYVLL